MWSRHYSSLSLPKRSYSKSFHHDQSDISTSTTLFLYIRHNPLNSNASTNNTFGPNYYIDTNIYNNTNINIQSPLQYQIRLQITIINTNNHHFIQRDNNKNNIIPTNDKQARLHLYPATKTNDCWFCIK